MTHTHLSETFLWGVSDSALANRRMFSLQWLLQAPPTRRRMLRGWEGNGRVRYQAFTFAVGCTTCNCILSRRINDPLSLSSPNQQCKYVYVYYTRL